jgi:hypothetical protein
MHSSPHSLFRNTTLPFPIPIYHLRQGKEYVMFRFTPFAMPSYKTPDLDSTRGLVQHFILELRRTEPIAKAELEERLENFGKPRGLKYGMFGSTAAMGDEMIKMEEHYDFVLSRVGKKLELVIDERNAAGISKHDQELEMKSLQRKVEELNTRLQAQKQELEASQLNATNLRSEVLTHENNNHCLQYENKRLKAKLALIGDQALDANLEGLALEY